jgi:hypothetical protein
VENTASLLALRRPRLAGSTVMLAGLGADVESFLTEHGFACVRTLVSDHAVPLLLGDLSPKPEPGFDAARVPAWVREGGTAICLQLPRGEPVPGSRLDRRIEAGWLPRRLTCRPTGGSWVGAAHLLRQHPLSRGLPADRVMDADYESVHPRRSLVDVHGELVAATIHYPYWNERDLPGYLGPEPVFWGADLVGLPHGAGRYILSTLRIAENLTGKAMAQALLLNLVDSARRGP